MPAVLAILGIINGIQQMRAGDKLGGAASVFGSAYNAGWFNTTPSAKFNNTLSDSGVRRNYL